MTEIVSITGEIRDHVGTGSSREIRRNGKIPAVIYGSDKQSLSIILSEKEITKYYRKPKFISQLFEIEIGGKKHKVLPKDVQLHPITDVVTHVDFMFLSKDVQKMRVPVVYSNKANCPGIKRGGYFNTVKRSFIVSCPVNALIREIEVDVSTMQVGSSLRVNQVSVPSGVTIHERKDLVIASIIGKKGKGDSEEAGSPEGNKSK